MPDTGPMVASATPLPIEASSPTTTAVFVDAGYVYAAGSKPGVVRVQPNRLAT